MAKKDIVWWVASILVVVGALNWGLVAFDFNLVEYLLGTGFIAKSVYFLVGASGIYTIYKLATM